MELPTSDRTIDGLPQQFAISLNESCSVEMVLVPPGRFEMGAAKYEPPPARVSDWLAIMIVLASLLSLLGIHYRIGIKSLFQLRLNYSIRELLCVIALIALVSVGSVVLIKNHEHRQWRWELAASRAELPAHEVTLTSYLYMSKYEITREQFEAVLPAKWKPNSNALLPAVNVSWYDATAFCTLMSKRCRQIIRLPSEAEWEYACRAGSNSAFCGCDTSYGLDRYAWYSANSGGIPHIVGRKRPNRFGLFDMSGNVLEWCHDWYGSYSAEYDVDPRGPLHGVGRVQRGGSYYSSARGCRCSHRLFGHPSEEMPYLGFRIVCEVDEKRKGCSE